MRSKWLRSCINTALSSVLALGLLIPGVSAGAANSANIDLTDIAGSYAHTEISELVKLGVISGYEDGTFQPQKDMSRAELAKVLVTAMGLEENPAAAEPFQDVPAQSWYAGYVGALVQAGVTQGTSVDSFAPDAKVTREALVVFFIRALGLQEVAEQVPVELQAADAANISDWAKPAVALAMRIGFVQGVEAADGSIAFDPQGYAQRQALARLAYEYVQHKSQYVKEASELKQLSEKVEVSDLQSVSSTSIEVTFAADVAAVDKSEFVFDHDLQVLQAERKMGSKRVVVLTTTEQAAGVIYTLSYRGKPSGKSVEGTGLLMGGFGGGGGGFVPTGNTVMQQLASGIPQTEVTISESGTYGPASGTPTPVQNLIIDPGPTGEVTLRNVNPEVLEVRSGDTHSIKLTKSIVKTLRVNAIHNNGQSLRIEVQDGAVVTDTEVSSQAILESSSTQGTLGKIKLVAAAAGQTVTLKGNIDGEVTVEAPDASIKVAAPTMGNPVQTVVKTLKLGSSATIESETGTATESMNIIQPGITIGFKGDGEIRKVQLPSTATGTTLQFDANTNVKELEADTTVAVQGDTAAIAKVATGGSGIVQLEQGTETIVKLKAIDYANELMQSVFGQLSLDSLFVKIDEAEKAMQTAIKYGAVQADFYGYNNLVELKQNAILMQDSLEDASLTFAEGDSAESVTQPVQLPGSPDNMIFYIWQSNHPDIISPIGNFQRPPAGAGDSNVTLTLNVYFQAIVASKTFTVKVKQWESSPADSQSLRSDLLLVRFDHAIVNTIASDYKFDHGLAVTKVTQYRQFPDMAVLTVQGQREGETYHLTFRNTATNVSLTGSLANMCDASVCQTDIVWGPPVPIPGVPVPGSAFGTVIDYQGKAIADVKVTLDGTNLSALTNTDGYYLLEPVMPGVPYTLTFTKQGYVSKSSSSFTIEPAESYMVGWDFMDGAPVITFAGANDDGQSNLQIFYDVLLGYSGIPANIKIYVNDELRVNEPSISDSNYIHGQLTLPAVSTQTYTIRLQACNEYACSDEKVLTYTMPIALEVAEVLPYNSVTGEVYGALEETVEPMATNALMTTLAATGGGSSSAPPAQGAVPIPTPVVNVNESEGGSGTDIYNKKYTLPEASRSADFLLIKLQDQGYEADSGNPPLAGVPDYSQVWGHYNTYNYAKVDMVHVQGEDYLQVPTSKSLVLDPSDSSVAYMLVGIGYTLNGVLYTVNPLVFSVSIP